MIRNILLVVLAVALVVTAFHFFHESRRRVETSAPQTVADILPQELKSIYEKQQIAEARSITEPASTDEAKPQDTLNPRFESNGLDVLTIRVINSGEESAEYSLEAGTVLQSAGNLIMATVGVQRTVAPGETTEDSIPIVPLRSSNTLQKLEYRKVEDSAEVLQPVVELVRSCGGSVDLAVLRTAALLLAENPPIERIAGFPTITSSTSPEAAAEPFRASAGQLLEALVLVKSKGLNVADIGLATDPQLQLETLVKPATNALAREFYGLQNPKKHWAFWKETTVNGDPRLKHYALYGIGRFFPDVAASMMPSWANNRRILAAYRLSAVYALGLAGTPEARDQLVQLAERYPPQTALGKAIEQSIAHIDRQLSEQSAGVQ